MFKKKPPFKSANINYVNVLGIGTAIAGVFVAILGHLVQNNFKFSLVGFVDALWPNIATDLTSISITVLIIDTLYRLQSIRKEKEELVLQLGSTNNLFALEALRMIKSKRWGYKADSTINGAFLANANLQTSDLSTMNLMECDLSNSNLVDALLNSTTLSYTKLIFADLSNVKLNYASLDHANLVGSNLTNIEADEANFSGANLNRTILESAKLNSTNLRRTRFSSADLSKASFVKCDFESSVLAMTNMSEAILINCNFRNVDFSGAILQMANLSASNLVGSFLSETTLDGACLYGANLQDVKELTIEQLLRVDILWGAIMPDGSIYDGRYNLKGDIKKAIQKGVDIKNPKAMAEFYEIPLAKYNLGQKLYSSMQPTNPPLDS